MGIVKCKLCGEDIVWVKLDSGESVACDPKPVRSSHIDSMLVLKPHDCHATQNKVIEISQAINLINERMCYGRGTFSTHHMPEHDEYWQAGEMAIAALEKQEQTKEAIPHRNYQYLSDYWCECGWHLGKKGDVKFCADCGRRIKWD